MLIVLRPLEPRRPSLTGVNQSLGVMPIARWLFHQVSLSPQALFKPAFVAGFFYPELTHITCNHQLEYNSQQTHEGCDKGGQ